MATAHSVLGPSSAERWIACPGSVALSERAGRQPTSYAAAEGTVAHTFAEGYAKGTLDFEALCARIGQTIKTEDGHEVEIIEEMVDGAVEYLEAIEEARKYFRENSRPMPVVERFETKVEAVSIEGRCWGTADHFIYRKGDVLFIDDYKFGKGKVVEVKWNAQGIIYAVGMLDAVGDAFSEVVIRIVQPRGGHADGTIREWRTTPAELRKWVREVAAPAAAETRKPDARIVAGDWCRWCPGKALCPVLAKQAQDAARADFSVVPSEEVKKNGLPDTRLLTVEQLGKILAWQDVVESYFVAVKALVTAKLEAGEAVPGWKLVEGRSNRQWRSEAEVVALYEPVLGEALWERKILSPAKLEKATRAKKGSIDHLTEKPPARKSVAPDTDPRPVAAASAGTDFGVVIDVTPLAESCPQCDLMGTCPQHNGTQGLKVWP